MQQQHRQHGRFERYIRRHLGGERNIRHERHERNIRHERHVVGYVGYLGTLGTSGTSGDAGNDAAETGGGTKANGATCANNGECMSGHCQSQGRMGGAGTAGTFCTIPRATPRQNPAPECGATIFTGKRSGAAVCQVK